jgi:two-component system chemotaxis response regulator CheB
MPQKLDVLVVDDSRTSRQMLVQLVNSAPDMFVVGEASDGAEAVKVAAKLRPKVILMDIVMPQMDGLQATREIMSTQPTPIVLITASLEEQETDIAFQAIRAGALTVLQKPRGSLTGEFTAQANSLLGTLRTMAGVHVIRHWTRSQPAGSAAAHPLPRVTGTLAAPAEIVAIASSTGGPAALSEIIKNLPHTFPLPIVIVQHIASDFVSSLAGWLRGVTPLNVEIAVPGQHPHPGTVYIAPSGGHLKMNRLHAFELDPVQGATLHMPSGDSLLGSVAASYGARAIGVVLTGMGDDGARGLRAMHDAGAFTIAQDEDTCVVYGMPQEAVKHGGVKQVLPLPEIAPILVKLSQTGGK